MTEAAIIKTIYLTAKPEKVWKYLTEKDKLARWFHETSKDLLSETAFEYFSHDEDKDDRKLMWGEVLEVDPPYRLVHTFTHQWLEGVITTVTWELVPVEDGTQLTLTHKGIPTLRELSDHDKGWDEHLTRLRSIVN